MSDSFLDKAGGYTPVPDELVRRYDFSTAYVWGVVWRYAQQEKEICDASHETIATRAGMSRRALIEKLNVLIKDGFIEDLTPGLKNKPHDLSTKKGEDLITAMQISHTESDSPAETHKDLDLENDLGMRISHSDNAEFAQSNGVAMQNLHSESAENAQSTDKNGSAMQNLHLKKEESLSIGINPNNGSKRERELHAHEAPPGPLSLSLAKVCLINLETISNGHQKKFFEALKILVKVDATSEQVTGFGEWWKTNWRGKNGSPPLPHQVCDLWGEYQASTQSIKQRIKLT